MVSSHCSRGALLIVLLVNLQPYILSWQRPVTRYPDPGVVSPRRIVIRKHPMVLGFDSKSY
jgi:hypothetical protein